MHFWGYPRSDGQVGTRNHIAVIPTVFCANRVVERIVSATVGAEAFPHPVGCGYPGPDQNLTAHILRQVARHPNFGAALLVGLGCERVRCEDLLHQLGDIGKPVDFLVIQEQGDSLRAAEAGIRKVQDWAATLSRQQREKVGAEHLVLGLKCGGTDAASGIAANPTLGAASDLLIAAGGTSLITEVTELIGAEKIMARRAVTDEVGSAILKTVAENAERLRRALRASPADDNAHMLVSPGNSDGGVTNVVEKALGGLKKAGKAPFQGVVGYAERPAGRGLYLMDGPGHDAEAVSGLIGGGANVVVFTTGRGTPTGYPGVPVIKITGNPETWERMRANLDFSAGGVIEGRATPDELGQELMRLILSVASGEMTRAEQLGHRELFVVSRLMATHRHFECHCPG